MITQEQIDIASRSFCTPLVLVLNFSLFQYLATMFFRRMREMRVRLLLITAAVSFLAVVPFSYPNEHVVHDLNDISEVCSVLTFLLQIAILTRDVKKKMKVRSLVVLAALGDALVLFALAVLLCNAVEFFVHVIEPEMAEHLDEVAENAALVYIFVFRFYFLSMARGFRTVLSKQKTEITFYLLFVTHEYPFVALEHATGLEFEHFQGLWMRITILMCLWMTIKAKITGSIGSKTTRMGAPSERSSQSLGPGTVSLPKPARSSNHVSVMPLPVLPAKR